MSHFLKRFIKICPKTGRFRGFALLKGFSTIFFPFIGLAALVWIIIRIVPRPNRIQYPCIKAAAPVAVSYLTYVAGSAAAVLFFKTSRYYFGKSKYLLALFLFFLSASASLFTFFHTESESFAARKYTDSLFVPTEPPNTPMGTGRGIFPGRVIWMWDSSAVSWSGTKGFWWDDNSIDQEKIDSMLSRSLRSISGENSGVETWNALFRYFNQKRGKGNIGYQADEKIAVKINMNLVGGAGNPGNASFTSPQIILALIRQLVYNAGVQAKDITFYDSNRYIPDAIYSRCKSEFPEVHFMGWRELNGREKYIRDTTIIHWSEDLTLEIGGGNNAYLPTVITNADYLINLANCKGHRYVGVTFCAKNHFGTISCDDADGIPSSNAPHAAGLHPYVTVHNMIIPGSAEWTFYGRPMNTYNALVDLMGHRDLGEKTLLYMIDALYAVQTEGHSVSSQSKWISQPFNNDWTSSLFISQDNVALESVALDFFRTEASLNPYDTTVYGAVDNYLHEAALADNPPSGTYYDPEGDGAAMQSLGVHEHWNNPVEKKYTAIDLVCLKNTILSSEPGKQQFEFILMQNYPNPFNPSTKISFNLPSSHFVNLKIFDMEGKEVALLISEELSEGRHTRLWTAVGLSSGIYFCRLQAGNFINTRKLLLLK